MGEVVADRTALHQLCRELEKQGRRVVLTNGAFDLLHVGHVRALKDARARGDVLLVAINDDASVRALKGSGRPIVPAVERAEIVAALACVDLVHVFQEHDVSVLLEQIRPHVHAKGRAYTTVTVPARETATRLGIEIAIVGDDKDHSVTDLIARVRAGEGVRPPAMP